MPFDLSRESEPSVVIHRLSEPDRDERYGLNGTGDLGGEHFDAGSWHQPSPQEAFSTARGEALFAAASLEDPLLPICLESVDVDAAPFSPVGEAPDAAALVKLAAWPSAGSPGATFAFGAPANAGEWIVRLSIVFATNPGPTRQESFFRLRVDAPPPIVDGTAGAPVACSPPGKLPPRAYLSVDGAPWVRAGVGTFSWRGMAADGPAPIGPHVAVSQDAQLRIRIEDNVCAAWWRIQLAPLPTVEAGYQEPLSDLVPNRMGYYNLPPGNANRFRLAAISPGDWVVGATFQFGTSRDDVFGDTSNFWHVEVR